MRDTKSHEAAMDWGKALWNSGFPAAPVAHVAASGNTAATIHFLHTLGFADRTMAGDVAASLLAIRAEHLAAHLQQMPLAARCKAIDDLPTWWASQERLDRVNRTLEVLSK